VKSGSESTLVGLVAVRITWITATAVCVVSILIGLLAGTDGGGSSPAFPGFGFSDGGDSSQQSPELALFEPAAAIFGAETQQKAQGTKTAAAQEDRSGRTKSQEAIKKCKKKFPKGPKRKKCIKRAKNRSGRTKKGASREGHSRSGVPPRSGSHPEGADGREPVGTPSSKHPQAPSLTPPKLPKAPSVSPPKLPKAPSVSPPKLPKPPSVSPPKLPQAPSVNPPKLPQAPSVNPPNLPKAASEIPVPSPPPVSLKVSAPVQTPITVPKISVGLP
jgi:hypothetical protein